MFVCRIYKEARVKNFKNKKNEISIQKILENNRKNNLYMKIKILEKSLDIQLTVSIVIQLGQAIFS